MKIGSVLNDYTMPGGESMIARAIAEKLGAARFERSSEEWARLQGLHRIAPVVRSFHNAPVLREFRAWTAREQPDVILFHNIFPVLSPSIIQEAQHLGIRVVLYLHSYRYLCTNGFFLNHGELCERCIHGNFWPAAVTACWRDSHTLSAWYGSVLATLRPRGFFRAVDRFIAISEFVRNKYVEAGLPAERITTLHHFVQKRALAGAGEDGGYVLYVGRLSQEKGVLTLIEAARRLPDIPFRIAGDGPLMPKAREALREKPAANVQLLGFVQGPERDELYRKACLVVVPSEWHECLGLIVLEAYSFGKPVLASRMGGLPEVVEEGRTGELFEARKPADLANHLRRMFDDPARMRDWGRNGRLWVESHCDPSAWESSMRKILEDVMRS